MQIKRFEQNPPLSLYVHYPWCVRKCPYCDFNSHQQYPDDIESAYIQALLLDLQQELPRIWGRNIQTVFIGGGTPSLMSVPALDALLSGIRALLPMAMDTEITMEANPGTAEIQRFSGYRQSGVNRLSIGVQSFDNGKLTALGRIHSAEEAVAACEMARAAGFDNYNIDLMYGLPGQDEAQAQADVQQAVALQPSHISHYQLTLEPNTAFYHKPPLLPDTDRVWSMQKNCQALLKESGYAQYEVSAYARGDRRCRHNLNYWRFGDYLGIGCGAHGKITVVPEGRILRTVKHKHPKDYLAVTGQMQASGSAFEASLRELSDSDLDFEFMLNALRLKEGVELNLFQQRTGLSSDRLFDKLRAAKERGLLSEDASYVRATDKGYRFLDDLLQLFLS